MSDQAASLESLLEIARIGDATAQYALGIAYSQRRDDAQALEWLQQAADQGHVEAQTEAARLLLFHTRTVAAQERAVDLLQQSEQSGNTKAGYYLALLALGDVAVPRDFARINARILACAKRGMRAAVRSMALYFGRLPDRGAQRTAVRLLGQAATAGDPICAQLLAERARRGEGMEVDAGQAHALDQRLRAAGIDALPEIAAPEVKKSASTATETPVLALQDLLLPVRATALSVRPDVRQMSDLLTAEECRFLIAMARPHLQPSRPSDSGNGQADASSESGGSDAHFTPAMEDFHLRLLQLRIAQAAGCELVNAEPLVVSRYRVGEQALPRRDFLSTSTLAGWRPEAGQRRTTVYVDLNAASRGGSTEFPEAKLQVEPAMGKAVAFENLLPDGTPDPASLHAATAIEEGEQWRATLWLREEPYRLY
jgi:prolyl 4-hydroxylase